MLVRVYDRVTGHVALTSEVNSEDMLSRGGGRYGLGDVCPPDERMTEDEWAKAANLPKPKPPAPEVNKVMAGEGLPMPADESSSERIELIASLRIAGVTFDAGMSTGDLKDLLAGAGSRASVLAQAPVNEHLHPVFEEPPAPAAAAVDPLDHDGDGKPGGSKPRKVWSDEEQAERAEVIAALKAAKVKFFLGAPTAKLKALLPA